MREIIIDASVVLKWYLLDEEYGQKALELLDGYVSEQLNIHAPSLLEYEVSNGLMIAMRRGRVKDKYLLNALDGFMKLGIDFQPLSSIYSTMLGCCKTYNISVYDASYLALAGDKAIPLVTADKRLFNLVRKSKLVQWIGNFNL